MNSLQRLSVFLLCLFLLPAEALHASSLSTHDDLVVSRGDFIRAAIKDLEIGIKRSCTVQGNYDRPVPVGLTGVVCVAEARDALSIFGTDLGLGRAITRGQALFVLTKLANLKPQGNARISFGDVHADGPLYNPVRIAIERDLMMALRPGLFGVGRSLTGREGRAVLGALTGTSSSETPSVPVTTIKVQTRERPSIPGRDILQTVWQLLTEQYLYEDSLNEKEAGYNAAEALVESLQDPYTVFLRPLDTKNFNLQLDGELSGIGAQVEYSSDSLLIVAPLSGSPAEKAGLKPGDRVTEVDGQSIAGMTLNEAVELVRGERGTSVELRVLRDGKTFTLSITRDLVRLPEIDIAFQGTVAVVKLAQFGQTTDTKLRSLMEQVQENNPTGVILDLRNNPGGLLHAAEIVLSNFLPKGSSIAEIGTKAATYKELTDDAPTIAKDVPVVVLINGGSASASEIVAGALQDYGRATVLGEKSFGKGTVQQIIEFRDGSSLKMTIAEWFSPKGRQINKLGVSPDIEVSASDERDEQMIRALELLR